MKRQKNPSDKKALEYRVEYLYVEEWPHLERRNWPKKKILRNQTYRQRVRRSVDRALTEAGTPLEDISPEPVRRIKSKRRGGAISLREWVEGKLRNRLHRVARKYFARPYDGELHREQFAAFLFSLTEGRSVHSCELARTFAGFLEGQWPTYQEGDLGRTGRRNDKAYDWLQAFFYDEPEWEGRLRSWIAEMTGRR